MRSQKSSRQLHNKEKGRYTATNTPPTSMTAVPRGVYEGVITTLAFAFLYHVLFIREAKSIGEKFLH